MDRLDHDTLKTILFESFSEENFLQWFYENEKTIEDNHKEFHELLSADWNLSILPDLDRIRELIQYKLIGQSVYDMWEIEFYLKRILEGEKTEFYCRRLYSEHYEDKGNTFLNAICDLIVLYCYNNKGLGLPSLESEQRSKVNSTKVLPRHLVT